MKTIGVQEAYRHFNKVCTANNIPKIEDATYRKIIQRMSSLIIERLLTHGSVTLPYKLGTLTVKYKEIAPFIKDGKLKGLPAPDWKATLELWEESEEDKRDKILVRRNVTHYRYLHYSKHFTSYPNKYNYNFRMVRRKRQELCKNSNSMIE